MANKFVKKPRKSCYDLRARKNNMAYITSQAAAISDAQTVEIASEVRAFEDRSPEAADAPLDLSLRDREAYFAAVLNPPPPNERLRSAARRYFESINI